jgi:hypothetical protein
MSGSCLKQHACGTRRQQQQQQQQQGMQVHPALRLNRTVCAAGCHRLQQLWQMQHICQQLLQAPLILLH